MDDICLDIEKLAEREKRATLANKAETKYKDLSAELAKILEENDPEAVGLAMLQNADSAIDGFVEYLTGHPSTSNFMDAVAFKVDEEDLPTAREYVALMTLKKKMVPSITIIILNLSKRKFLPLI